MPFCRVSVLLVQFTLAASLFAAEQGEADWPQFRGPTFDGHAPASAEPPLTWSEQENVAWKTEIAGRGWSSPVVLGDQIWFTTASEDGKQMFGVCLSRETGEVLFNKLLFENEEPREIHKTNSYASPTPALEPGRVYLHFGSYGVACLDTKTFETVWTRRDLPCNHYRGPGSSPLLYGDLVITHYDGFDYQYVVALNKHTGENVWKVDREVEYGTDNGDFMKAYCTPLVIEVEGQKQLISPTSKASIAYDPATGEELWRIRYSGFSATARPLYGQGLVFINTGFSKATLIAVKPGGSGDLTSEIAWEAKKGIGSKPSSLLIDDLLYILNDPGTATCLVAATGEEVWTERLGGNYSASPVYAAGRIYFTSEEGTTTVIAPGREYKVLAENTLDTGCMASPAVSGDSLIVRTKTHVYRLRGK